MFIHYLQLVIIKLYLEELKGNKIAESVSALTLAKSRSFF